MYSIPALRDQLERSRGRGGLPTVPVVRALHRSLGCTGDPTELSKAQQIDQIIRRMNDIQIDTAGDTVDLPDPSTLASNNEGARRTLEACLSASEPRPEPEPEPEPQPEPEPAEPRPETGAPNVSGGGGGGGLDAFFANAIRQTVSEYLAREGVDRAAVNALVQDAVRDVVAPTRVSVPTPSGEPRNLGLSHRMLPQLIRWAGLDVPVYLFGPAGSGKSTAARQVADALGLDGRVCYVGCNADSSAPESLAGFVRPDGQITRPPFRDAWEGVGEYSGGAVILIDELDRAPAGVAAALNGALDGQAVFPFPDGTSPRHPRTRIILAGNTRGDGGDALYAAAERQDAAVRDRCVVLEWDYDDALTDAVLRSLDGYDAHGAEIDAWSRRVRSVRARAAELGIPAVFGPRAEIYGARALIVGGLTGEEIERACLADRVSDDDWQQITAHKGRE